MILSASGRTDIPAYYAEWFYNRVKEGFAFVRNPFYPNIITRYKINPDVIDSVIFCSKNPRPMLDRIQTIMPLRPYFFVTITPYGRDIEPNVPDRMKLAEALVELSSIIGKAAVCWRYDPIILTDEWTVERHEECFGELCRALNGSVHECVISFLQLYEKTKRNFPEAREIRGGERVALLERMIPVAKANGIRIRTCADLAGASIPGLESAGCITRQTIRGYAGKDIPKMQGGPKREGCKCDVPSRDIGAYNSCPHGCAYCYANFDMELVEKNRLMHDPGSALLIGKPRDDDVIQEASQKSFFEAQLSFEGML